MTRPHRALLSLATAATACACALLLAAPPVLAAGAPGWRVVLSRHYPVSGNAFSGFGAIVAISRTDAWALGGSATQTDGAGAGYPVAVHWNGRRWHASPLPAGLTGSVIAASASAPDNVWAASSLDGYVLHWNGRRWSAHRLVPKADLPGEITGITAVSSRDVWVFGASGAWGGIGTWHYNGRTWAKVALPGGYPDLLAGSALSAASIWGVTRGIGVPNHVEHYNGRRWRIVSSPALRDAGTFTAVVAESPGDVWAAGVVPASGGRTANVLFRLSRGRWTRKAIPHGAWPVLPSSLISDGHGGLWLLAGFSGPQYLMHLSSAGKWSRTLITVRRGEQVSGLAPAGRAGAMWGAGLIISKTGTQSSAVILAHGKTG